MFRSIALGALFIILSTSFSFAETMSVAFSGADVRTAPTATAKVVFKATRYTPLNVINMEKEYAQVSDYRNRKGYVHKSLLKPVAAVVVTGDRANVRSGPGTANDVVFQMAKGDSALLLGQSEGWVEIKTADEKTGWIADFLVWGE